MTKDRISEMLKMMRENDFTAEHRQSVPEEMSESVTSFLEQVAGSENWVECCRNELRSMRDQVETLKRYHSQIQRSTNETTKKDIENKVEEKKTLITSSIIAIRNNVKSIQEMFSRQKMSPALMRMKEVQIDSLVRSVNEITQDYYNCLVDHSEKCKQLLYEMISLTNEDKTEFEELIHNGKVAFFTNNLLLNELEQKINFQEVEDRHRDILKVEQSILELKNLTQDLSLVVAIQAEKVDFVEEYVEKTAKKVDLAAVEMRKASKKRKAARMRKLIISLSCISLMIFVIAVIAAT